MSDRRAAYRVGDRVIVSALPDCDACSAGDYAGNVPDYPAPGTVLSVHPDTPLYRVQLTADLGGRGWYTPAHLSPLTDPPTNTDGNL